MKMKAVVIYEDGAPEVLKTEQREVPTAITGKSLVFSKFHRYN